MMDVGILEVSDGKCQGFPFYLYYMAFARGDLTDLPQS